MQKEILSVTGYIRTERYLNLDFLPKMSVIASCVWSSEASFDSQWQTFSYFAYRLYRQKEEMGLGGNN